MARPISGLLFGLLVLFTIVNIVRGASMMLYKKNENDKYEQDLVAVSSTVIPLTVYEASVGVGGGNPPKISISKEYQMAYLKHLHKKVKPATGDQSPDRLITVKNQNEKAATVRSD